MVANCRIFTVNLLKAFVNVLDVSKSTLKILCELLLFSIMCLEFKTMFVLLYDFCLYNVLFRFNCYVVFSHLLSYSYLKIALINLRMVTIFQSINSILIGTKKWHKSTFLSYYNSFNFEITFMQVFVIILAK